MVQSHIRDILDSPFIKIALSRDLPGLHSFISTHIVALEILRQPVKHWDDWLITIMLRKFDHQTICAWQLAAPYKYRVGKIHTIGRIFGCSLCGNKMF